MVYIASYEPCEPKRFSRCCSKVERKYIKEQQPNQIHCYIQNMGFANRMDHSSGQLQDWYPDEAMNVVLQGARVLYRIKKDEGDESPFF